LLPARRTNEWVSAIGSSPAPHPIRPNGPNRTRPNGNSTKTPEARPPPKTLHRHSSHRDYRVTL
jgi:hypothetical protein